MIGVLSDLEVSVVLGFGCRGRTPTDAVDASIALLAPRGR
jgi:hypothetical protein